LKSATVGVDGCDHSIRLWSGFLAIIARRETPLISGGTPRVNFAVVEAMSEAARTDARVSPGQILEQVA